MSSASLAGDCSSISAAGPAGAIASLLTVGAMTATGAPGPSRPSMGRPPSHLGIVILTARERPDLPESECGEQNRGQSQRILQIHDPVANVAWRDDDSADDLALRNVPGIVRRVAVSLGGDNSVGVDCYQSVCDGEAVLGERHNLSDAIVALMDEDCATGRNMRAHRPRVNDVHPVGRGPGDEHDEAEPATRAAPAVRGKSSGTSICLFLFCFGGSHLHWARPPFEQSELLPRTCYRPDQA